MAVKDWRSPLARARGLGSAGAGFEHWWRQRLTALALIPLFLWLGFSLAALPSVDYFALVDWLNLSPINAALSILTLVVALYHGHLGVQVVAEDYISCRMLRLATVLASMFASAFLAVAASVSILYLAFAG